MKAVTPPYAAVGARLRQARIAQGYSQVEVAQQLGVTVRALFEWESGTRLPHSKLPQLTQLYHVTTHWLLEGTETTPMELQRLRDEVTLLQGQMAEVTELLTRSLRILFAHLGLDAAAVHGNHASPARSTRAATRRATRSGADER